MHTPIQHLLTLPITLSLFLCSTASLAIDKCLLNGVVTYTDLPCPAGSETLPFTGQVAPSDNPAAAHERNLANQKKLDQILKETQQRDRQLERDARVAAQQVKQRKDKESYCKKLDDRRKYAQQLQAKSQHAKKSQLEQAQRRLEQAKENYAEQCLGDAP